MKNVLIMVSLTLAMIVGVSAQHLHNGGRTSQDVTIIGEVIDPVCYLGHDNWGKEHVPCAKECLTKEINLGILEDKTDQVYMSLPVDHTNPNAKLKDFIAAKVKVTGTVYSKGGLQGIYVKNVEPLEE